MMFWRIEVKEKEGFYDALGESVKRDIEDLGLGLALNEHRAKDRHLGFVGLGRGFVD